MRIKHKVRVQIARDALMKNFQWAPDDVLSERVIDAYRNCSHNNFEVAANTNEDLPLGDITLVKGVFLEVDFDCIIKLNGGTDELQLRKAVGTPTPDSARFFAEMDITEINLAAPAGQAITGVITLYGDAAS